MTVYGERTITKFAYKHATARKPLARFLAMARTAGWKSFSDVKQTFSSVDYVPSTGLLIFNIGGNKYRLVATVDFGEQIMVIKSVMTHDEYTRESF
jgi:mRNA interferase HigB